MKGVLYSLSGATLIATTLAKPTPTQLESLSKRGFLQDKITNESQIKSMVAGSDSPLSERTERLSLMSLK